MAFKVSAPKTPPKGVKAAGGSGLTLPTKMNEPPKELTDYVKCIFGEKGVGKTSLATALCTELKQDHLVYMYDPGRSNLRIRQIPERGKKPISWDEFKRYQRLNIDEGSTPIVDPIDGLYKACISHHCEKQGVKDLGDLKDHGKGWRVAIDDFYDTMNLFRKADLFPMYISHVRARPMLVKGVTAFAKDEEEAPPVVQPTSPGACWEYLRLATDMAWYMGYRGLERVLHVRGSEFVWAGGGIDDHFLQPKGYERQGEQLNMIPMGKSPKEAAINVIKAWNNELPGYFYGTDTKMIRPKGKK